METFLGHLSAAIENARPNDMKVAYLCLLPHGQYDRRRNEGQDDPASRGYLQHRNMTTSPLYRGFLGPRADWATVITRVVLENKAAVGQLSLGAAHEVSGGTHDRLLRCATPRWLLNDPQTIEYE